jgi:hypothetical protein
MEQDLYHLEHSAMHDGKHLKHSRLLDRRERTGATQDARFCSVAAQQYTNKALRKHEMTNENDQYMPYVPARYTYVKIEHSKAL